MFPPRQRNKDRYMIMETQEMGFRSEAHGWDCQDVSLINPEKPVGLSKDWSRSEYDPWPYYSCVAFALADGWELLGPPTPTPTETDDGIKTYYNWFFIKRHQIPISGNL